LAGRLKVASPSPRVANYLWNGRY